MDEVQIEFQDSQNKSRLLREFNLLSFHTIASLITTGFGVVEE